MVEALVMQVSQPKFNPHNPCKGERREQILELSSDPFIMVCHVMANTLSSFNEF